MKKNSIWIPIEYKKEYSDFDRTGLKLHFLDVEIVEELRCVFIKFCKWLRKNFWFPIQCNIRFEYVSYYRDSKNSVKKTNNADAIFYFPTIKESKITVYPDIRIAVSGYKKEIERYDKHLVLSHYLGLLAHELTHYFQWYFFESDKRGKKSLEIEANRWADYLAHEFISNTRDGQ